MVAAVAVAVPTLAKRLMATYWPGPLTLVLPAHPALPPSLTGGTGTIGVRLPGHGLTRALVSRVGSPVTAPSANPHGAPSPRTAAEVASALGAAVDLILDGGPTPGGLPSTLVDVTGPQPRILRPGVVVLTAEELAGP
jgi:L-threonylcarbamoyladenylate synthase